MGTMRNDFAGASVIVILMLSTSQSLPLDGNENSSKRNSLPDTLTPDPGSTSPSIYECLFIDPDLPLCDIKWLSNSDDSTGEGNNFHEDVVQRSKRNIDISAMNVVVHTIEGCLPLRLPFSMPSCEGISLDRIVDIQRFRPFMVKGVTKPPFVFPEFNYPEWLRMMTRLRNHVSSKTREEEQNAIDDGDDEISIDDSIQVRIDDLINRAAMKTIPKGIAANVNIPKGSSSNGLISGSSSKSAESTGLLSNKSNVRSTLNAYDQQFTNSQNSRSIPEIPAVSSDPELGDIPAFPLSHEGYKEPMILKPSDEFLINDNLGNSLFRSNIQIRETDNGIEDHFLPVDLSLGLIRQTREVRLSVPSQKISEESQKTQGIAGKSVHERYETAEGHFDPKMTRVAVPERYKKKSKSLNFNELEVAATKDAQTIADPSRNTESHVVSINEDSPGIIDGLESTTATWRKIATKDTTSRKKYRSHVKL